MERVSTTRSGANAAERLSPTALHIAHAAAAKGHLGDDVTGSKVRKEDRRNVVERTEMCQ